LGSCCFSWIHQGCI